MGRAYRKAQPQIKRRKFSHQNVENIVSIVRKLVYANFHDLV
jgi:hypothetical protein